jgi:uncharacterized repeat protein (TIGR01451 family)
MARFLLWARPRIGTGVTVVLFAIALGGALPSVALAAPTTWTVNTTSDAAVSGSECEGGSGDCSLRQAVAKAAPGDTVALPASATPYAITLGVIAVDKAITISGAGARTTTIAGNDSSRIFDASALTGTATISGVTINGGSASGGGALQFDSTGATIDLDAVALTGNQATADGGAIYLLSGTLNITDSTLGPANVANTGAGSGNGGGAVYNGGGTLSITNSTISGNSVADGGLGGGIFTAGPPGSTNLSSSTVTFNTVSGTGAKGGNIYVAGTGATVTNTIVADGSSVGGGNADCFGTITSDGHNLTDGIASTGVASCGFTQPSDILADARLGPLADNGGPTNTHELAAGSPAIDAGSGCPQTDQRGVTRPSGSCDIGALQVGGGGTPPQWSVAHDFRTSPQENPSRDSLGNRHVWSYEQAPSPLDLHNPGTYTLLPSSGLGTSCTGPDFYFWANPGLSLPVVDFNAGSTTYVCSSTVTAPAQTVVMHPSGSDYSIVAWTSPVSGSIAVAGSFVSMDANGGSGTTWYVNDGSTTLVSGTNAVGGSGSFGPAPFTVAAGDTLYFILGPTGAATYETTELNLTITSSTSPASADLALTGVASSTSIDVGQPVTDTFTVTNNGPDTSDRVTLSDPLPAGATLQSASASQGSCSGTTTLSCLLGSLASGAQATVTVTLVPTTAGALTNTAAVSASTADPNEANNSATATSSVGCTTSMTLDAVEVLADCISQQSDGTYLASGDARFGDGARIVDAGTQMPAALVLNPAAHTISIAPASGGGAQSGELEAGGVDVATGDLLIATQGVTDSVSGVSASARVSRMSSVDLSLSGWTFSDVGVSATVYLASSSVGGGAIVDGQLTLPTWLGSVIEFGPLGASFPSSISGQLAVQASSSGQVSVVNGGISFQASVLGDPSLKLAQAQLSYQRAGDRWSGSAILGMASLVGLTVNPVVISDGKLVELEANFSCATSKICGTSSVPTIGAILDVKDVSLRMINLQGISYAPFMIVRGPSSCIPRFRLCAPPPPAPQIDGNVIVGLLGDRVIAGGGFTYLLDGAFSASGRVGLAPLYGGKFPDPAALQKNQSAQSVVNTLLTTAHTGVELAGASIDYTPPHLLQATGTVYLPPPPFPFQFLQGRISIGIDPPHFTGEGSLNLVVPGYVPVIGGDTFGGVQALISDKAAAAEASTPQYCIKYIGCTPSLSVLVAFNYSNAHITADINGGNINDYATVPQATASTAAVSNRRVVRVPAGKQLASFTIRSARGTPNVQVTSPRINGHIRRLTLATSRRLHNHSGALAWVDKRTHSESFLVFLPRGGRWTVKRRKGPRIVSVKVMVPRHKLHKQIYPRAVEHARDLPTGTVSTSRRLTLHYDVPNARPGTTVDLWAGTGPRGAGGVMIADGLPPSGAATWSLSGLSSGRYWPYAIVNQNGIPVSIHYWPRPVDVANPAAPPIPTGVEATLVSGKVYVTWNGVPTTATYAISATPAGGSAPVRDAVPATQVADQLTLGRGKWSITVQAVNAQDQASLPSAATSVTMP